MRAGDDAMLVTGSGWEPRRLAFVLAGLSAGGAERVLSLLSADWVERGRQVTVIAFDHDGDPIFHPLDPRVEVVRLNLPPAARNFRNVLRRILALRRALRAARPNVTVSFLTKVNVLTLLASLGTKRRVIISERNNPRVQAADPLWNRLLARLQGRAESIVMQTEASLACLTPAARARATVIGNPIAEWRDAPPPRNTRVLAAAGRLTPQKGFDLLIEAFERVAPRHPEWRLRIWGEGELRPELERMVAERGLRDRVDLPGNSKGPAEWIRGAEAFVLSSRYEGFGNVLGEAMSAGLPAVSFACDFGPGVLIRDEVDGLLVPPGDVEALAAALDRLLGDEALRDRLGGAARASVARFAPERVVARWEEVLRGPAVSRSAPRPASLATG